MTSILKERRPKFVPEKQTTSFTFGFAFVAKQRYVVMSINCQSGYHQSHSNAKPEAITRDINVNFAILILILQRAHQAMHDKNIPISSFLLFLLLYGIFLEQIGNAATGAVRWFTLMAGKRAILYFFLLFMLSLMFLFF